ncbi:MAG: fasciclin domain-containing protein [Leeuwenhoekiella sp.]|nr:fasciclin domain-containing protein [Leeuwenhoekiella sp.]
MKSFNRILQVLTIMVLTTSLISCSDDDDNGVMPPETNTIADIVSNSDDFDILLAAAVKADLVGTLSTTTNTDLTVFAPTDAAFISYLGAADETAANSLSSDVVANLLLNHVLGTLVTASEITSGYVKALSTNADGDNLDLYVGVANGTVTINGISDVTTPDVAADNGVIHVVDAVIPEATIATFASADSNFSTLLAAVVQEDLAATLSGAGTFTVFAPTNDAFQALIDADPNDGITSAADILALGDSDATTTSALDNILRHHVLGATVRAEDLSTTAPTPATPLFAGGGLSIDATVTPPSVTDGSGATYDIVVTNVTGTNGVVHAITGVLMPEYFG